MDDKCVFNCDVCGSKVALEAKPARMPECCDQPMVQTAGLPVCEATDTAEHSRLDGTGDPCDDGRSGKI